MNGSLRNLFFLLALIILVVLLLLDNLLILINVKHMLEPRTKVKGKSYSDTNEDTQLLTWFTTWKRRSLEQLPKYILTVS